MRSNIFGACLRLAFSKVVRDSSKVAVEKIGSVLCVHCNCMAGLGEACSHIGGVLFALEANVQARKSMSCTLLSC